MNISDQLKEMIATAEVTVAERVAHDDGQTDEDRDGADHQSGRDDQTPQGHGYRVGECRPDRGLHRRQRPDVTIEQQRKSDDADRQHDDGKDEADEVAHEDQIPTLFRACHIGPEL